MEQTERSETSEYKIQTPGNYPEESMQQNNFVLRNFTCNPVLYIFQYNKMKRSKIFYVLFASDLLEHVWIRQN
jgi:hypothetical protein